MRKLTQRRGFTLLELLVVIAIIGILMAMAMPAVQQVRAAAQRTACLNKLRQIGLATTMFHDANRAFPPARIDPGLNPSPGMDCGKDEPSWLVRIMPYVELNTMYVDWDLTRPYSSHPADLVQRSADVFVCPSRRAAADAVAPDTTVTGTTTLPCGCGGVTNITVVGGATGDYAGNHGDPSPGATGAASDYFRGGNGTGVIISSRATCLPPLKPLLPPRPGRWVDRISMKNLIDGSSSTILAGELHVQPDRINQMPYNGPIYNGEDLAAFARIGGPTVPIAADPNEEPGAILGFGSWHPGTCNFVMSDGSTRPIAVYIDTETLGQLCHRADGKYGQQFD